MKLPQKLPAKIFDPRFAFLVTLLVSLGALGFALIAQFAMHLKPCILCLWQRLPYVLLFLDALAFFFFAPGLPYHRLALAGMAAVAFAGAALAFTHFGVEQKWWIIGTGCPIEPLSGKTDAEALAELLTTPQAPCDEVKWRILGLSATFWNMLLSLALSVYLLTVSLKARRA